MDDINHLSYRLCSKNLPEDRSSAQLSLLTCAGGAPTLGRSPSTPSYSQPVELLLSPRSRQGELWCSGGRLCAGHHAGRLKGHFHITTLYKFNIRSQKRKSKKESKYHFNENLKEAMSVFLWEYNDPSVARGVTERPSNSLCG